MRLIQSHRNRPAASAAFRCRSQHHRSAAQHLMDEHVRALRVGYCIWRSAGNVDGQKAFDAHSGAWQSIRMVNELPQ